MSALDDVKESIYTVGKDVTQKAKEVSEIARLKLDIRAKEDFVDKQYQVLGKEYYEMHKAVVEPASEQEVQFHAIAEALEEIQRMKDEVLAIQGATVCEHCGSKVAKNAAFCSNCGAKMSGIFED